MTASGASGSYPRSRYAWTIVFLLLLAYLFVVVDWLILNLLVEPIRRDLHISDTQISFLQGFAFVFTFASLGIVTGRVADRGNRRTMIVIAMAIWCVAAILCGFAANFTQLLVLRMLVSVGEATLHPAAYSLIADYFPPEKRGRAVSVYTTGGFVGAGLALILGAFAILATGSTTVHIPLVGTVASWQAAFLFVGVPGIGVAAAMMAVREPYRQERQSDAVKPIGTLAFLRSKGLVFTLVIGGISCSAMANYSLINWSPTLFIRVFGWSASKIGIVYGLILIGPGIAGILLSGWLSDRLAARGIRNGAVSICRLAIALIIPSVAWVGLGPNPIVATVTLAWCTFLFAVPAGLAPVAIYELTPNEYRGQLIAIYMFLSSLFGMAGGATLVALINDRVFHDEASIGKAMTIVATGAALLCFLALSWAIRIIKAGRDDNASDYPPAAARSAI